MGYADHLGDDDATGRLPGQRLMATRALPLIYERLWRPLGGRVLMAGVSTGEERRRALGMLQISSGDRVLDLACGTGAFARLFAAEGGEVTGVDASRTMLEQGARA